MTIDFNQLRERAEGYAQAHLDGSLAVELVSVEDGLATFRMTEDGDETCVIAVKDVGEFMGRSMMLFVEDGEETGVTEAWGEHLARRLFC